MNLRGGELGLVFPVREENFCSSKTETTTPTDFYSQKAETDVHERRSLGLIRLRPITPPEKTSVGIVG